MKAAILVVSLVVCLQHHVASGQPINLDLEITESETVAQIMPLQVPSDPPERNITLANSRSYNITCRSSVGFGTQTDVWFFVHPNGTETPVPRTPQEYTAVYSFFNPSDTYVWTLRFQNFSQSLEGNYSCISPDRRRTLLITSRNPTVITSSTQLTATEDTSLEQRNQQMLISGLPQPNPATNVTWYFNDIPFTPSYPSNVFVLPQGELLFPPSMGFQHEGLYTIMVTTSQGVATDSFYIDIQAGPNLQLTSTPAIPLIGDTIYLTCTDRKGTPIPQFTWLLNDSIIINGTDNYIINQYQSNISVLTIPQATFQHNGVYSCRANNSAGADIESLTINVLLPSPTKPALSLSSGNPPFYAGSSLVLTCQSTLLTTSLYSGTISAAITWKRNHTALVLNESATVVQTNEGLVYTSTLTLSGLSYIRHSGPIMCEVMTTTPDGYTSLSVTSDSLDLNVQVPSFSVELTPSATTVLNFGPYNTVQYTCATNLPQNLLINTNFIWYTNSTKQLLTNAVPGVNITYSTNSSILTLVATDPGIVQYSCSVEFDLPFEDPIITVTSNTTLNVKGPLPPLLPTNIVTGNIDHRSAVIQWTVPSISYSPETYYIKYGKTADNLQYTSTPLAGTSDLTAKDQTLSLSLQYLEHGQIYYYKVIARNIQGETTSSLNTFTTQKLALIQFKAGPFRGCSNGRVLDSSSVQTFMKQQISQEISSRCGCTFPVDNLINGTVLCTETNSDQLIFRVYIVSTSSLTSAAILNHVTQWIQDDPVVTSGVAKVTFDTSCNISISTIHDPICTNNVVTTEEPPTDFVTSGYGSNTDILITVVAGAVILLEAVIIVILIFALCYQNSKIRILMRKRSNYSSVRRASSTVSDTPTSKWKGDAYVTTECPAYLSAYKPKIDYTDDGGLDDNTIEQDMTPAIYDSIDHLNRPQPRPPVNLINGITGSGNSDTEDTTGSSIMTT